MAGPNRLVAELMDRSPCCVHLDWPVDRAHRLFLTLGLRHIVVMDRKYEKPLGIITRHDLVQPGGPLARPSSVGPTDSLDDSDDPRRPLAPPRSALRSTDPRLRDLYPMMCSPLLEAPMGPRSPAASPAARPGSSGDSTSDSPVAMTPGQTCAMPVPAQSEDTSSPVPRSHV